MLQATDLGVTLGRKPVLAAVRFTALPGALTAIVGPNGSGKTTLLRALTGDIRFSGQCHLNGHAIAQTKPWVLAAMRAVLPQATPLSFPFTVLEVVRLGLAADLETGPDSDPDSGPEPGRDLPMQALARVGLTGFEGRLYQELSGGEQQRVQLARVLVQVWKPVAQGSPRWLFLDEPVSSLDLGHQLMVMRIARAFADAGGGVVAVMHDLNLTAMFADSVALLAGGRLIGQDSPAAILTDDLLTRAYACRVQVNTPPARGPYILPQAATPLTAHR